jgi:pantoate--beta-alanine ligase
MEVFIYKKTVQKYEKKWHQSKKGIDLSLSQLLEIFKVQVFTKVHELKSFIKSHQVLEKTIGFVPTMGALHAGHGSLISEAKKVNELVVASIFVNPTQFNNASDLDKYPRSIDADCAILSSLGCDAVLIPSVEEIYTNDFVFPDIDLGFLDQVMEGKHRPGHFQGVVQVVYRLFEIVTPTNAYFGLKDFQQVAVIRFMTTFFKLPIQIVAIPTLREASGLAMSSRNLRLSLSEREEAVKISETLYFAKKVAKNHTPEETKNATIDFFNQSNLKLEYFEIVDPINLERLTDSWVPSAVACIVAYCGEVLLIDNLQLN